MKSVATAMCYMIWWLMLTPIRVAQEQQTADKITADYSLPKEDVIETVQPPKDDPDLLKWTESPDSIEHILRDKSLYNRYLAPGQLNNEPTYVSVAIYFESMNSFQAQTMDFESDMYLAQTWFDRRLNHTNPNPILITDLQMHARMWYPDLYFVNSKAATLQAVTTPNFMVMIYPDGLVFKSLRVAVTLSCMMNFEKFPLDEQDCPITIQSYAYVREIVNLTWFVDADKGYPIAYNPKIKLNDMVIVGTWYEESPLDYPMLKGFGVWSYLTGHIKMKRFVMFHVFQTYIPTGMLVCISWLSFWLDVRASPARISLTITTLLTLTTMSNGARQGLPQVSYVKAIDIWLNMCTGFVFCVLLEYTLVCFHVGRRNMHCIKHVPEVATFRVDNTSPMVSLAKSFQNGKLVSQVAKACPVCAVMFERSALRIDYTARVVFPVGFFLCATVYWGFYLSTYMSTPFPQDPPA